MILYFSATGNCKYVATRLTQAIGQEIHSIVDCIRNGQYDFSDDTIGVISPTYDWGLLSIMKEFLEKASFQTDYLYFIATYGTTHGAIGYMANKAIRGKTINAFYVVRMVDTWTPIFDLSTPGKIAKYTKKTETRIDRVIRDISTARKIADAKFNHLRLPHGFRDVAVAEHVVGKHLFQFFHEHFRTVCADKDTVKVCILLQIAADFEKQWWRDCEKNS